MRSYKQIAFFILVFPSIAYPQGPARITEEQREILTYAFNDPNPVPIYSRSHKIYPYHNFEGYSKQGKMQKWKVVKLENDYIEVYVLPESGGKIYGAIEKSTGKEFIYRNEVLKFRNIAMRGPWTSGGVEFNFGIIGHHPATATPVDYTTRTNDDGSVSCFVGNLDLPSRTNWCVEIRLAKDKAYVETRALWINPTSLNQSYYNWMTAAAVVTDDLEFYYPGYLALDHDGTPGTWPIDKAGHNLAKYKENNFGPDKSFHTVGEFNDFMGGYYHNSKFGFGHWALYDEMPGHKLWLWAQSRSGGIWEDLLTDTDGQYMEYQAGRMFDQYSPSTRVKTSITQTAFTPHTTDRWTEIWFPCKDIGGIKEVSPYGVLNVVKNGNTLDVGINALTFADATIEVKSNGKIIHTENKKFKPMDVLLSTVQLNNNNDYEVSVKGMDLTYQSDKKNLLKRPFMVIPRQKDLAGEELFSEGLEQKEYREYDKAKLIFQRCLQKDSLHFRAITNLAELLVRSAKYDSALWYVNRVLRHDTYDPGANFIAGTAYNAKGDFINALESFGWAARAMEYRSVAYAEMAAIKLQQGDLILAEHYAGQALDNNRYNFKALHSLAVVHRKLNRVDNAKKILDDIELIDPLDHFSHFERYVATKSNQDLNRFSSRITNEFPYQTYIEVALEYVSYGLKEEALLVLAKAPNHPLVSLWKSYLNKDAASLSEVANASPAFVFPYRTETLAALQWAAAQNNNWKFDYYLGLNYMAIQQRNMAVKIFEELGQQPDYAPFYLTRARLTKNSSQILSDLQTANRLAPGEWRTWDDLIAYYESTYDYTQALAVSTNATKKFTDNYTLGFQHAKALLNAGKYEASIQVLKNLDILPFEGSSQGQEVYEQAMLSRAVELIQNKKYKEALARIEESREWPEHLGVGKPYDPDTRIQDYLTGFVLTKLGKSSEAQQWENKVVTYTEQNPNESRLNNVLALLILKKNGETQKMDVLLRKIKGSSTTPAQRWVIAAVEQDAATLTDLEKNFRGNQYMQILKKIINL